MGYSPWGHKELDMTEQLTLSLFSLLLASHQCFPLVHTGSQVTWSLSNGACRGQPLRDTEQSLCSLRKKSDSKDAQN